MNFSLDQLIYDLSQYTGMTSQEVYDAIEPTRIDNRKTWEDFRFVNPDSPTKVTWYNRINRTFIWECSLHPPWEELNKLAPNSKVLDYGAGIGTDCLWMKTQGHHPTYFDINLAESDFFSWRNKKYNMGIPIIKPFDKNGKFDFVMCINGDAFYDVVLFRDVLEHVPDYIRILGHISSVLAPKGYLYIQAPFGTEDYGVHMRERWPVSDFLINNGFQKESGIIWKRIS